MKEHERKELKRLEELRKTIEKSPLTKQIIAEEAAGILATRTEAAGKIEDLKKERGEIIPKFQADLAGKEAKYKKAKTALDATSDVSKKAKAAVLNKSHLFETAINKQREILIETAAPEIDEGILFFQEKLSFLRSPGKIDHIAGGSVRNIFTYTKTVKEESNVDAVRSALQYCLAAIKELEQMKLTPVLAVEKIERMKAGVPDIGIFAEITGEKPLPRVNADPFAGMASDSELDWRKGQLTEKVRKVLSR